RAGSMIGYFLNEGPVTNFEEANNSDLEMFSQMYREMANEGIFLPPSQFEGTFLSTAHTEEDIQQTIEAFDTALSRIV
ncbi:aspartate aminotransferase family protein, partial [Staphylococcus aureus]|nr:aspartate aminotransferase family protein [Staphylococcus aureus]